MARQRRVRNVLASSATAYAGYLMSQTAGIDPQEIPSLVANRFPGLSDSEISRIIHVAEDSRLSGRTLGQRRDTERIRDDLIACDPTLRSGYQYQVIVAFPSDGGGREYRTAIIESSTSLTKGEVKERAFSSLESQWSRSERLRTMGESSPDIGEVSFRFASVNRSC